MKLKDILKFQVDVSLRNFGEKLAAVPHDEIFQADREVRPFHLRVLIRIASLRRF